MISKELEKSLHDLFAKSRIERIAEISVEHLLRAMLDNPSGNDVLVACGADIEGLRTTLNVFLAEKHAPSAGNSPVDSQPTLGFQRVIQRAILQGQSGEASREVVGAHIVISIFSEKEGVAANFLHQQNISRLDAVKYHAHGTRKFQAPDSKKHAETVGGPSEASTTSHGKGSALDAFAKNLNKMAAEGDIDPLVGRDDEVERVIQILCRRKKNNPLLVGEPGVGKTAIAEGLAWRIIEDGVPDPMKGAIIYSLDVGALVAGTKLRGDIEMRLKAVLKQLSSTKNSILFIDEIHTIIGAGSAGGTAMDVSNLLKPALANGQLRCIGATTFSEYRSVFTKDPALDRRFQKVDVPEPSAAQTVKILQGLKSRFEDHHDVKYTEDALVAAVDLASRFIHTRQFPDKAIDVIDEAGAAQRMLPKAQRKTTITRAEIEAAISSITKIPAQNLAADDRRKLRTLDRDLKSVVFGQDAAIDAVAASIRMARAGIGDTNKTVGSFLFSGPTGVGKTEVARQLAYTLGLELIRIDMSEYMEKHSVSRLIGPPPGHAGFTKGGRLTEAITKDPHAVLLLDEVEKADADVLNLLLQVMDHGTITDGQGRKIDCKNIVLIMTTNAGAESLAKRNIGFQSNVSSSDDAEAIKRHFSSEFRNRLDASISFAALDENTILRVVDKFLFELEGKFLAKSVEISFTDALRRHLAAAGFDPQMGARPMTRLIQELVVKHLADEILFGKLRYGGCVQADFLNDKVEFTISQEGSPKEVDED